MRLTNRIYGCFVLAMAMAAGSLAGATFTDPAGSGGTIPDNGTVVHRTVVASGLSGTVNSVSVTITGLTHSFPQDLDFLLVSPAGDVRNLEFWSDVAGQSLVTNFNITVADSGAVVLPPGTPVNNTTYKPAENQVVETNAYFGRPDLTINHPPLNGAATFASAFNGIAGNGTWDLYVKDDESGDTGDFDSWSITILTTGGNQPPAIANLSADTSNFTEGGVAVHLDTGTAAAVTDSDSANFDTGNLTASITVNEFTAQDEIRFDTAGAVTLSAGHTVGSTVSVSATAVGTIAAGGTGAGGNDLIVTFNAGATPARVTTLVNALSYFNSNSVNPNINSRTLAVSVSDGDGGTSPVANVFVNVAATGDEGMTTFTNATGSGTIPDGPNGAAVVQTINVAGLLGNVTDVRVTITGLTHAFVNDLDFLLVAPAGGTRNLEFCSDAGGPVAASNVTISVADFGPTALSGSALVTGTTYRAGDFSTAEPNNYFGPSFTINHPRTNGIAAFSSGFAGSAPNGNWTLYVRDGQNGDVGSFAGWSVAIATDAGPPVNGPPVTSNLNLDNPTFTEGGVAAVPLDVGGNASVTDSDSPNFDTGNVTVSIVNKFPTEDVLGISTAGAVSLSAGVTVGSHVSVSGTDIGTITANGSGASNLVVTLNASATPARVTTLVNALTYFNSNGINPNINPRMVPITVNDGDGATSLPANVTVNVAATGDEPMTTFTNATGLTVPDNAPAVSQTLTVSGLSGPVLDVKVTITGLTHGFPQDLNFLLVAPEAGARNLEFWGNAAGQGPGVSNVTISVADFGAPTLPGGTTPVTNTTYRAGDYATADPNNYFGPTFPINHPTTVGTATFATAFVGATPNGVWTLYVRDASSGHAGSFTGWSIAIVANIPPTVSNISKSGNEDAQITFTAANFDAGFSDSDVLAIVRVTSLPANGTLKLSGVNVIVNQDIPRAQLGNLTFDPVGNFNGATSFGWNGSDGALFAAAGALVNITVNAVNDAPAAVITPPSYAATENVSLDLKSTMSVSDVDALTGSETATLSVGEGTLNVTAGGSGAVVGGSGTSSVTIAGTIAQINALLATDGSSTVAYIDNDDDPAASTTLTLSINDNGNTGTGGALGSNDTATINVTAVNDAPAATIVPTNYSATEGVDLNLKNNGLSVTDVDGQSGGETATLSVGEGTLTVTAGDSGAVVSNSGTASVTIAGTVAQINALLGSGGTGTAVYRNDLNPPSASTPLTLLIHDNGHTGTGGDLSGSDTATIDITATDPDLVVQKQHTGTFHPGQVGAEYRLTVRNTGNAPTSGTVTLTEVPPVGITVTQMGGTDWSCNVPALACTRSDTLVAGNAYQTVTVTVNVAATAPASLTNQTTVGGGGEVNTANSSASDPTDIDGLDYFTIAPCGLVDTRSADGPSGGPALAAGASRSFPVRGVCGVPTTAVAVALNVTVIAPTATGFVTVWDGTLPIPGTSSVSYAAGQIRAGNAIVAIAPDGKVTVLVAQASGTAQVILATSGYFE